MEVEGGGGAEKGEGLWLNSTLFGATSVVLGPGIKFKRRRKGIYGTGVQRGAEEGG